MMIGRTLGSYQITGELSRGGMGAVYTAVHTLIGRPAAVKIMLPEFSQNQEILQRFFNEAKTTVTIGHPGIVEILDFGFDAVGMAYLVMEFLDGQPLSKCLQAPMNEDRAIALVAQVASALRAAHARGIVHRDLKPANIMVIQDANFPFGERTKILDFGIAKLATDSEQNFKTRTGQLLGTPAYMAPEQCRGAGNVDHRADLYALGCILFHMLCGRPLFVADGYGEVLGMHMYVPPPSPSRLRPEIDPIIEAIVLRLLEKDAGARYQSADALLADITAIHGYWTPAPGLARAPTNPPVFQSATSLPVVSANVQTTLRASAGAPPVQPMSRQTWRSKVLHLSAIASVAAVVGIGAWLATQHQSAVQAASEPEHHRPSGSLPAGQATRPDAGFDADPSLLSSGEIASGTPTAGSDAGTQPAPSSTMLPTPNVMDTQPAASQPMAGAELRQAKSGSSAQPARRTSTPAAAAKSSATREAAGRQVRKQPAIGDLDIDSPSLPYARREMQGAERSREVPAGEPPAVPRSENVKDENTAGTNQNNVPAPRSEDPPAKQKAQSRADSSSEIINPFSF